MWRDPLEPLDDLLRDLERVIPAEPPPPTRAEDPNGLPPIEVVQLWAHSILQGTEADRRRLRSDPRFARLWARYDRGQVAQQRLPTTPTRSGG